ncbi:MAG: hypothetical protein MI741_06735, partial [Rhodospirillales bacterium]|nr:hypothetical protein [Rhodospirillales bacterium]
MGNMATPKDDAADVIELNVPGAETPVTTKKTPVRKAPATRRTAKPAPAVTVPGSGPKVTARGFTIPKNLRTPKLYLNRELTWLSFNRRVLNEARDPRTPLLERVKFLAIGAMTLDEFIMKRMGGLKQQVGAGVHRPTVDGRTPQQQIDECLAEIDEIEKVKRDTYLTLVRELAKHDIKILAYKKLTPAQKEEARAYYLTNIFPLVTPLAMDPAHPFPHLSNLSLNLLASLQQGDENESVMARVKVPVGSGVSRFLKIGDKNHFVPLEEVMANNLDLLFPDRKIHSCELFR